MRFRKLVSLLCITYETSLYLVEGQTIDEEKNDCTKLYNFVRGDNEIYSSEDCCSESGIKCENGNITFINT